MGARVKLVFLERATSLLSARTCSSLKCIAYVCIVMCYSCIQYHAVQTVTRIRIGGSPIMPTSARERDKLQCKQTMDKYTCQVKAVLIIFS